jgi:hypothetical protein
MIAVWTEAFFLTPKYHRKRGHISLDLYYIA